ncbi:PREDICTED: uncharacterized protein LOC104822946 [Tarenaya hassleriana]|uniref:uncharacterized protein LOC104822946 n=1 Tax=Tarenaya hassleriana TaxID=28532 RepID=UPI00053C9B07|nr:PREDICTED: uncharacterized protein LOC104822946 [Tarenaya hassleriana]XP_010552625.1 PREDICTED: uncharacterized protein LOC104822946 [Tarenaya hassleriana]
MLSIPNTRMWNLASSYLTGNIGLRNDTRKAVRPAVECRGDDDDDASSVASKEEGLECPICWESFNIVENVPYVLWCGHTLCKNCILGLQWAVVKFPTLPVQLPLFISCPWCNLLSFRLVFKGTLKFPRKNYFVLWMVERMNGERLKSNASAHDGGDDDSHRSWSFPGNSPNINLSDPHRNRIRGSPNQHEPSESGIDHRNALNNNSNMRLESIQNSLRKSLVVFVHMTAKFPLVIIFLLIVLYAIPTSAAILALYILITLLLALPSFLILYFAYPCLDWLVREIVA